MVAVNIATAQFGTLSNFGTTSTAFPSVQDGSTRGVLSLTGKGNLSSLLNFRAVCKVTTPISTNITFTVYCWGTTGTFATDLTTFGNDTAIASSTSIAINNVTRTIALHGQFFFNGSNICMNYLVTQVTNAAQVINNSFNAFSGVSPQFFCTALFSVSNAANTAILTEFSIDQD